MGFVSQLMSHFLVTNWIEKSFEDIPWKNRPLSNLEISKEQNNVAISNRNGRHASRIKMTLDLCWFGNCRMRPIYPISSKIFRHMEHQEISSEFTAVHMHICIRGFVVMYLWYKWYKTLAEWGIKVVKNPQFAPNAHQMSDCWEGVEIRFDHLRTPLKLKLLMENLKKCLIISNDPSLPSPRIESSYGELRKN